MITPIIGYGFFTAKDCPHETLNQCVEHFDDFDYHFMSGDCKWVSLFYDDYRVRLPVEELCLFPEYHSGKLHPSYNDRCHYYIGNIRKYYGQRYMFDIWDNPPEVYKVPFTEDELPERLIGHGYIYNESIPKYDNENPPYLVTFRDGVDMVDWNRYCISYPGEFHNQTIPVVGIICTDEFIDDLEFRIIRIVDNYPKWSDVENTADYFDWIRPFQILSTRIRKSNHESSNPNEMMY